MNENTDSMTAGRLLSDTLISMRTIFKSDEADTLLFEIGRKTAAMSACETVRNYSNEKYVNSPYGVEEFLSFVSSFGDAVGLWNSKVKFLKEDYLPRCSYVSAEIKKPFMQSAPTLFQDYNIDKFLLGYMQTLYNFASDMFRSQKRVKKYDVPFVLQTRALDDAVPDKMFLHLYVCNYDNAEWDAEGNRLTEALCAEPNETNISAWLNFEQMRGKALVSEGYLKNDAYII